MQASADKKKIMIISTATPERPLTDSGTIAQGRTGQVIQRLTGAGMYCIGAENAEQAFSGNVGNNSWVMITGHGRYSGGFTFIEGASNKRDAKGESIKVECDTNALADMIVGNQLRSGDNINIMLFVCNGGVAGKDNPSFAEQLAQALAAKEINSHIIAVVGICPRLGKVPANGCIDFVAQPDYKLESKVVVFDTQQGVTQQFTPTRDIEIRKDGVHEPIYPYHNSKYSSDPVFHKRVDDLYEELLYKEYSFDKSMHTFLMNDEQAANYLQGDNALIHVSPRGNYQITYRDDNKILHEEFSDITKADKFIRDHKLDVNPSLDSSSDLKTSGGRFGLFRSLDVDLSSSGKRLRNDQSTEEEPKQEGPK